MSGIIEAICISEKRGTQKKEIPEANLIEDWGLEGDAHGGKWHRQVSLLSFEKIEAFKAKGAEVNFGAFGENLVISGFDFRSLPVGTRFKISEALLELTQIGKECHSHCAIYHKMGDCIMPREGVFTKVIKGGHIKTSDKVELIEADKNRPYTAAVITLSDRASKGEYEDKSGPLMKELLEKAGYDVVEIIVLPDERKPLEAQLIRLCDQRQVNLICTTGGTGFSPRDITPEATIAVCERMVPGIAEGIRSFSMSITKKAMLSRAVSGIRGTTLIINLPGSPKAVKEALEFVLPVLPHGLGVLNGRETD